MPLWRGATPAAWQRGAFANLSARSRLVIDQLLVSHLGCSVDLTVGLLLHGIVFTRERDFAITVR